LLQHEFEADSESLRLAVLIAKQTDAVQNTALRIALHDGFLLNLDAVHREAVARLAAERNLTVVVGRDTLALLCPITTSVNHSDLIHCLLLQSDDAPSTVVQFLRRLQEQVDRRSEASLFT